MLTSISPLNEYCNPRTHFYANYCGQSCFKTDSETRSQQNSERRSNRLQLHKHIFPFSKWMMMLMFNWSATVVVKARISSSNTHTFAVNMKRGMLLAHIFSLWVFMDKLYCELYEYLNSSSSKHEAAFSPYRGKSKTMISLYQKLSLYCSTRIFGRTFVVVSDTNLLTSVRHHTCCHERRMNEAASVAQVNISGHFWLSPFQ